MRTDVFLAHHESGHYGFRSPWTTARESPTDFLVIWVTAGTMAVTINGRSASARPGDLVLLEPEVAHVYRPGTSGDWEWFWLHFDGAGAHELWSRLHGGVGSVRALGLDRQIRARFVELVTSAATSVGSAHNIRLDTCACSLLGLMVDRLEGGGQAGAASSQAGISHLTSWILTHLDAPLALSDLVQESGWSAAHLTRMMHHEVGLAPMQYVNRLRIRQAEWLLRGTELTVAQVAQMVGYDDPLHFSRRFRQLSGRSPSQVRQIDRATGHAVPGLRS